MNRQNQYRVIQANGIKTSVFKVHFIERLSKQTKIIRTGMNMQVLKKHFKQHLTLISISLVLSTNFAMAATDLTAQENYLKARVKSLEQNSNHSLMHACNQFKERSN